MPKIKEQQPTLDELTAEQKENTSSEYIAAVNASVEEGLRQLDAGQGISDEEFWREFDDSIEASE